MMPMQGHGKSELHWLYNTKSDVEPPKIYSFGEYSFWFEGTGSRNSEKLLLYLEIPANWAGEICQEDTVLYENFLLGEIAPVINELSGEYVNQDKNVREKAQFSVQEAGPQIIKRSGICYTIKECNAQKACNAQKRRILLENGEEVHCLQTFLLQVHFNVPLVNALSVNAKAAVRAVKDILQHVEDVVEGIDREKLERYLTVFHHQRDIRAYLRQNGFCAFIADGSILPRENNTALPMKNAIPFVSPQNCCVTIPLSDGTTLSGMAIRQGITVITGGGYSGKSTLLDSIEMGIYNHIPGDGREYVITDDSALKIYAEDGRPVTNLDMSPFFRYLHGDTPLEKFSTPHASGSVSQAANIIEAVCGGAGLLLIDEDKSATNFMIQDQNMRKIIRNETIIPFTDRLRELYMRKGVSTILVIGGSSEYLSYAHRVILMDNYRAENITEEIRALGLPAGMEEKTQAHWQTTRRLVPRETNQPFLYFKSVETENEKRIILDDYSADITLLTAVLTSGQMNTLAYVAEHLLLDMEADNEEMIQKIQQIIRKLFSAGTDTVSLPSGAARRFYEEIRPIDVFCCVNRMYGLNFCS